MKKILLVIVLCVICSGLNAQSKPILQEYAGRYILPAGSPVDDAIVTVVNDTTLFISASPGESELKHVEDEKFILPQYGGAIIFIRNEEKKVTGFKVTIPIMEVEDIEAVKEEAN